MKVFFMNFDLVGNIFSGLTERFGRKWVSFKNKKEVQLIMLNRGFLI